MSETESSSSSDPTSESSSSSDSDSTTESEEQNRKKRKLLIKNPDQFLHHKVDIKPGELDEYIVIKRNGNSNVCIYNDETHEFIDIKTFGPIDMKYIRRFKLIRKGISAADKQNDLQMEARVFQRIMDMMEGFKEYRADIQPKNV